MNIKKYITIPQLAELLGVSRITIYNRVRNGEIPATKIGKNYFITDETVSYVLGKKINQKGKKHIETAVRRTVSEYGEVLKQLSRE